MNETAVAVAVLNLLFCLFRFFRTLAQRRLMATVWFLLAYFSFFFIIVAFEGTFSHRQGYTGDIIKVIPNTVAFISIYVFVCNLLFAAAETLTWSLLKPKDLCSWQISSENAAAKTYMLFFGLMLIGASILYGIKMRGLGYLDYVEFKGSNWPMVFLFTSTPFITLSMMKGRHLGAFIGMLPFIYFAINMHIRSFALVSLIPALIIFVYKLLEKKRGYVTLALGCVLSVAVLLITSGVVTMLKRGHFDLPDSGMVYGMGIAFQKILLAESYTGFISLQKYFFNILMPFIKLLGISRPDVADTPVYLARLIDGIPRWERTYFHFPVLWYTDAFISFGKIGVLLGVLWGGIIAAVEAALRRNTILLGIILPVFTWHNYMILRGATAIASVPLSYAIYFQMIIVIAYNLISSFFREKSFEHSFNQRRVMEIRKVMFRGGDE